MEAAVRPYLIAAGAYSIPEAMTPEEELQRREDRTAELQRRQDNNTPTWLTIIDDLAHGDRTQWSFFFEMPVIEFLNTYSFTMARKKELAARLDQVAADGPHAAIVTALHQLLFTR
jgi:hypothetical protein